MMKKVLSCAICVAILFSMAMPCVTASADSVSTWDGNPVGAYKWLVSDEVKSTIIAGSGTIHITDASQLAMLAAVGGRNLTLYEIPADKYDFEGITFILDTDIDLNNKPWSPICSFNASHPFKGTFDGNGHVIKNMYGPSDSSEGMYADNRNPNGKKIFGLFGYMVGTVKNVKVKNVKWEYNSANGASVPAGGGITAFIGSYGDNITMGGVVNDYIAMIDNCSVEDICFDINSTKTFGTHGFGGVAGVSYNGSIVNTYVKNLSIDASHSANVPTNCTSHMYIKTLKHKDGFVSGMFEISNCFALGATITTGDGTTALPVMHNEVPKYCVPTNNYSDTEEKIQYDNRTYVADEDALRDAIVTQDSPYYCEGEGKPVVLRSETGVTDFSIDYDGEEFTAMANLAKVDNKTMIVIAIYDVDGDIQTLSDVSIAYYDKDADFNSTVLADMENDSFDSDTQIAKAFIISPQNAMPYVKALKYED